MKITDVYIDGTILRTLNRGEYADMKVVSSQTVIYMLEQVKVFLLIKVLRDLTLQRTKIYLCATFKLCHTKYC
jgi:hypothetical protein